MTTETETTVLRIEGAVLLESLEQAPMLATALDRSNPDATNLRRRPQVGERVTVDGATVVVVGAGYPGKRRIYGGWRSSAHAS